MLLKHGRQGKPKVHYFRLGLASIGGAALGLELRWKSSSGGIRSVLLAAVVDMKQGPTTDVFKRHPLR